MKTYLITGGAGFIGSHFIEHILQAADSRVINIDKLTYAGSLDNMRSFTDKPGYIFVQGDIGNAEIVMSVFQEYDIDIVVNFAAESHVDRSIEDASPFLKTNVLGTGVLLEAARTHWKDYSDKMFLQISTDEVYGSLDEGIAADESYPLKPGNPYSASKAAADLLVLSYFNTYKVPVIISRCCNNFGPRQYPEKLIPLMLKNIYEGKKLPVYGDGMQQREWIYVEDHCRILMNLLKQGKAGEIYNIGSGLAWQNITLVKKIMKIYSLLEGISFKENIIEYIEDRKGHDRRYGLNTQKIKDISAGAETSDFEKYLWDTIQWHIDSMNDGEQ